MEINESNIENILSEKFTLEHTPYKRAFSVYEAQSNYKQEVVKFKGYLALSDAFKCFFLETLESFNELVTQNSGHQLSQDQAIFISKIVTNFNTLCSSECAATNGYPYDGYSLLRNVFESTILISAALQKKVTFEDISGFKYKDTPTTTDPDEINKRIKKHKKNVERSVFDMFIGRQSGFSHDVQKELRSWKDLFDLELHGSRLSVSQHLKWFKGEESLPYLPSLNKKAFAMFMNRYVEISWLLTKTLPSLQDRPLVFSNEWKEKYEIMDKCFELHTKALSEELGKDIGDVMVRFTQDKFPFDQNSEFPRSK